FRPYTRCSSCRIQLFACCLTPIEDVCKAHLSVITIQRGMLDVEVGKQDRQPASVKVVADCDTHICLCYSVLVVRHAGSKSRVRKVSLSIAAIQIVGTSVIRHEQVKLAVFIKRPACCADNALPRIRTGCIMGPFCCDLRRKNSIPYFSY